MSPRTTEQVKKIRESSKQRILEAALELFAKQGYQNTSISEIASQAQVSKGLIYNYFDGKEDLLKGLWEGLEQEESKFMEQVYNDVPEEMFKNIIDTVFDQIRQKTEHWKMMTVLTFQVERFDFVHESVIQKMKGYFDLFESLLIQMGIPNPHAEAKHIGALIDGIAIHYLVAGNDYPLDDVQSYFIEKYCGDKN